VGLGGTEIFLLEIIAIKGPCNDFNYCHVWYRIKICCEVGLTPELSALVWAMQCLNETLICSKLLSEHQSEV